MNTSFSASACECVVSEEQESEKDTIEPFSLKAGGVEGGWGGVGGNLAMSNAKFVMPGRWIKGVETCRFS